MLSLTGSFKRLLIGRILWLGLYLVKAVLAMIFVIPVFLSTNATLSSSVFARSLVEYWDISVLVELLVHKGDAIGLFAGYILAAAVLYLVIMQFVNGGLYFIVVSGKKLPEASKEFWQECGGRFWGHLKITLLMLVVYMMLLFSGLFVVNMFGVFGQNLMGTPALIFMFGKLVIIFLILLAASIFSDSARAVLSADPDKPFKHILKIAADFFRPRFTRLIGIYIVTYLPFVIIWLLVEYLALAITGSPGGLVGIFLEFVFFQLAAVARTAQKLWYLFYMGSVFREHHAGRFLPRQAELKFE